MACFAATTQLAVHLPLLKVTPLVHSFNLTVVSFVLHSSSPPVYRQEPSPHPAP